MIKLQTNDTKILKSLKKLKEKWYKYGKLEGKHILWNSEYNYLIRGKPRRITDITREAFNKYKNSEKRQNVTSFDIKKEVEAIYDELNNGHSNSTTRNPGKIDELCLEVERTWEMGFKKGVVTTLPMFEELNQSVKKFENIARKGEHGMFDEDQTIQNEAYFDAIKIAKNDKSCLIEFNGVPCRTLVEDIFNELYHAYEDNYKE